MLLLLSLGESSIRDSKNLHSVQMTISMCTEPGILLCSLQRKSGLCEKVQQAINTDPPVECKGVGERNQSLRKGFSLPSQYIRVHSP